MAQNWQEKQRTSDVEMESNISFDKMMLSDRVLLGLTKNGFTNPSPIQLRAIPLGISGLGKRQWFQIQFQIVNVIFLKIY